MHIKLFITSFNSSGSHRSNLIDKIIRVGPGDLNYIKQANGWPMRYTLKMDCFHLGCVELSHTVILKIWIIENCSKLYIKIYVFDFLEKSLFLCQHCTASMSESQIPSIGGTCSLPELHHFLYLSYLVHCIYSWKLQRPCMRLSFDSCLVNY